MASPPFPTRSGDLDRPDGARIHWRVDGPTGHDGPRVVLLAPEHRTLLVWSDDLVTALHAIGASCVRLDWREQGRSEPGPHAPTFAAFCGDTVAVLDELQGPLDVVVGVGLGAMVARHVASAASGSALVVVNGFDDYLATDVAGPDEADVVRLVLRGRPDGGAADRRALLRELRLLGGSTDGPDGEAGGADVVVDAWLAHGQRMVDRHRQVLFEARPPTHTATHGGGIRVLHGAENRLVPLDHGRVVARRLGVDLRIVPTAGHHLGPTLRSAVLEEITALLGHRPIRRAAH